MLVVSLWAFVMNANLYGRLSEMTRLGRFYRASSSDDVPVPTVRLVLHHTWPVIDYVTTAGGIEEFVRQYAGERMICYGTSTEWLEIEANRIAAALLIPKHILVELLTASPIDIEDEGPLEDLSKKFNVSKATLQCRIRNLLGELATKRRA